MICTFCGVDEDTYPVYTFLINLEMKLSSSGTHSLMHSAVAYIKTFSYIVIISDNLILFSASFLIVRVLAEVGKIKILSVV